MPKSNAERVRGCMARKRDNARKLGLCTRCCRERPKPGRLVCAACNASTVERNRRLRQRKRDDSELHRFILIRERAGDEAGKYHLYTDATHYYQEALNIAGISLGDRERIAEKIGGAFFLSGDLKSAHVWFEHLLTMSSSRDASKSVETLFRMHRQVMFDCKGDEMVSTLMRALHIAETCGDARLLMLTQLRRVEALQLLGRFEEAATILREVGNVNADTDASLRGYYLVAHAMAAGADGNAEKAFENFEAALDLTKKDLDPYRVSIIWARYANVAMELGDTMRAKACYEHALFVARQYQITWMIALRSLYYAKSLVCIGQSASAHSYLLEALSFGQLVPYADVHRACVGIPVTLLVRDETALAQCARPKAIVLAFRSGMSDVIGAVSRAFAQLYASQGRLRAARALLHRALEKITDAYFNLDLLIAIAQHGAPTDIPQARGMLEARSRLPHARVFRAGITLFDAFVERRQGSLSRASVLAQEAAELFDGLQWHGYAEQARSIVPGSNAAARTKPLESIPFSHLQPALTARERDVAALVLRGFSNRQIANDLGIALHTVEKHMNSIMHQLGVRSRYQVADLLESASE